MAKERQKRGKTFTLEETNVTEHAKRDGRRIGNRCLFVRLFETYLFRS